MNQGVLVRIRVLQFSFDCLFVYLFWLEESELTKR